MAMESIPPLPLDRPPPPCQFGREPSAQGRPMDPLHRPDRAPEQSQSFGIVGDVGAPVFATWIARHARRLGLRGAILRHDAGRLDLVITGLPDLLDAMALGCRLGTHEVWVDHIDRADTALQNLNEFASMRD